MAGTAAARIGSDGKVRWVNGAFRDAFGVDACVRLDAALDGLLEAGVLIDPLSRDGGALVEALREDGALALARADGRGLTLAFAEGEGDGFLLTVVDAGSGGAESGGAKAAALVDAAFASMSEAVAVFDAGLRLVRWNPRYLELFRLSEDIVRPGVSFESLVRRAFEDGVYGVCDIEASIAERVVLAHRRDAFAFRLDRSDGVRLDVRHAPLPDGGFLRIYTDLSERARAYAVQRQILDAIAVPMVVSGLYDGWLHYGNRPADELFGFPLEAMADRATSLDFYVDPDDRRRLVGVMEEHGRVDGFETRFKVADGRVAWVLLSVRRFRYRGEDAILTCIIDISERKRVEEQFTLAREEAEQALKELKEAQAHLIQSEKMAALGSLVAGVAHEVNTPVGIALTGASLLAERTKEIGRLFHANRVRRQDLADYLETADEATHLMLLNIDRAAQLIHSFKQMAVDQASGERRAFDLRDYIIEVLRSLGVRLKRSAHRVELDCPEGLEVDGYPGALSQILTNLVMNSIVHAFAPEERGTLRIAVRRVDADEVELRYSDDGRGIPEESLARVFEPFFTTNRAAGGSGLGLNIVYNIANRTLRGRIDLDSGPGRGTTFILRFPRVLAEPAPGGAGPAGTGPGTA